MDPVSVFTALYDTKFLSFASKSVSGESPYHIDLRRLSLYPKLMNAIVSQVAEKHLAARLLQAHSPRLSSATAAKEAAPLDESLRNLCVSEESDADSHFDEEIETSSGDETDGDLQEPLIICSAPTRSSAQLATAIAFKAQLPHLFNENQVPDSELIESLVGTPVVDTVATSDSTQNRRPKRRVIFIEDVIASGEKTLEQIKNIEQGQKFKVQFVICVVDCNKNEIDRLEQEGVQVMSLYSMEAILRILEITGRITRDHYSQTIQWLDQARKPVVACS